MKKWYPTRRRFPPADALRRQAEALAAAGAAHAVQHAAVNLSAAVDAAAAVGRVTWLLTEKGSRRCKPPDTVQPEGERERVSDRTVLCT